MGVQRRLTTRPEFQAEVITNSLRSESQEFSANLGVSVLPLGEPLPLGHGPFELFFQNKSRLTMLPPGCAFSSRLSLSLT
jgi:hypothetical protein